MDCPNCGLNLEAIKRSGKLGCENCVTVFREDLLKIRDRKHPSYFIETSKRQEPGHGE